MGVALPESGNDESFMDKLRRYIRLRAEVREHTEEAKNLKAKADALEKSLLWQFEQAGMSKSTIDGMTAYLHRQLWVSPAIEGDYVTACTALRAAGLGEFVEERFNSNTVSAYFRELERDGKEVPAGLNGALKITEQFSLRTRKA